MSEPTPIRAILGLDRDEVDEPQSAAEPTDTAGTTAATGDDLTIDEALAALHGEAAPQETQAPAEPGDPTALTPEQIAALIAENDQFKAHKAKVDAEQAADDFEAEWGDFYWDTIAVYDQVEAWIKEKGAEHRVSEAEINAEIHNRVYLGKNLTIPGTNTPMTGRLQWERDTLFKYANAKAQFMVAQGQQHVDPIAELAQQYHLDEADTQALAKFRDMPRERVEELARTLGAKNQRVTATLSQATIDANRNVAQHLSQGIHPGVPGTPAPTKPYVFKHTPDVAQKETQYVVDRLFRRTG